MLSDIHFGGKLPTKDEIKAFAEAERKTKINRTAICMTCRGYHKTAGGVQWKYKE